MSQIRHFRTFAIRESMLFQGPLPNQIQPSVSQSNKTSSESSSGGTYKLAQMIWPSARRSVNGFE